MTFPNLFLSLLKTIRPKEYGLLGFVVLLVLLFSSVKGVSLNQYSVSSLIRSGHTM